MRLTADYIHRFTGYHGFRSKCRIRIYEPEDEADALVVVCSERPDNPGTSVTNAAEQIAAEVIKHHRIDAPPVWIEHYPAESRGRGFPESFNLVIFSSYEVREVGYAGRVCLEIGKPVWKHLDRATVEALIGQSLR